MDRHDRPIVLGVGNTLCRDEGVGVHLLAALEERLGPVAHDVRWVDGGTLGLRLLDIVESSSHLLILDALDADRPPGTVLELSGADLSAPVGQPVSGHEMGLTEVLQLAAARDRVPGHLRLIGVQPADMSMGVDLSAPVAGALPEALATAECVLRAWGLLETH